MFPQGSNTSVRKGIVTIGLVWFIQRYQRFVTVGFLDPLHAIARIGEDFLTSLPGGLVGFGVEGPIGLMSLIGHIGLISPIQINKVYRSESPVFLHLTDDTSNSIAVVGVVLAVESNAVVADGKELSALGDIPADTLVHDGNEVMGFLRTVRFLETLWNLQLGKQYLWLRPVIAVLGGLEHGARWRYMLVAGVTEEVQIELVVPIGHHRLMVVRPTVVIRCGGVLAVGMHSLDVVDAHYW